MPVIYYTPTQGQGLASTSATGVTIKGVSLLDNGWVRIWDHEDKVALLPPDRIHSIALDDPPEGFAW
jgi:hypothetical protein